MHGKGQQPQPNPAVAGLDELDVSTNQTDVPHPIFAGTRKLPVSWFMTPVIAFTKPTNGDNGKKGSSTSGGGGKKGGGGGGTNTYDVYGHCAGAVCQGRLDFIWGVLVNNTLVWPPATVWDAQVWQSGLTIVYTDGNCYNLPQNANVDPPNPPWTLVASPWVAGAYLAGAKVLNGGQLWKATKNTSTAPGSAKPVTSVALQQAVVLVGDWQWMGTPTAWATVASTIFWQPNDIVAWQGQLYYSPVATKAEPPAAPWLLWRQNRSTPNPVKFTVPNMGDMYLYWGTDNQTLDTVNEGVLAGLGHPPYRSRAFVVLKNFLFGTMQMSPPDVVILGGRAPVQTLITGASANLDSAWQANPWCVLAEFLTHPIYGLGLPNSMFDATTWQAEADFCAANPQLYYISPIYTSVAKVRELTAELLGYPDAFVFWNTLGKLQAGHWPHGEAPPAYDNTNTVNRDWLTKEFDCSGDGFDGTVNSVSVSFNDIQAAFRSRPVSAPNLFNRQLVGRLVSQNVDKPFITRAAQAHQWATELARLSGDIVVKSTETEVRAEKATAIQPGSQILVTDDVLGTSQPHRVTKKIISAPPAGTVKLQHETERGLAPQPYSPTPVLGATANSLQPAPITNALFCQLPSALANGQANTLAVFASRENLNTTAFDVWFRNLDQSSFQSLGTVGGFGVSGLVDEPSPILGDIFTVTSTNQTFTLSQQDYWLFSVQYETSLSGPLINAVQGVDYTYDAAGTVTLIPTGNIAVGDIVHCNYASAIVVDINSNTPSADLEDVTASLTTDEILDNTILLALFQAGNTNNFELMSVKSLTALGGGKYFINVRRQQYGTLYGGDGSYVWGTNKGDIAVLIRRDKVTPLYNKAFDVAVQNAATVDFILSSHSALVTGDPTNIYDQAQNPSALSTQWAYTFSNPYSPSGRFTLLLRNEAVISDLTAAFAVTDTFKFSFQMFSPDGKLTSASLIAAMGSREYVLWSNNFQKSYVQSAVAKFTFPVIGSWFVYLSVSDSDGNRTKIPITTTKIPINIAAAGTCPTPVLYDYSVSNDNPYYGYAALGAILAASTGTQLVTAVTFGWLPTGLTVKYQIQPNGTGWSAGAWQTATPGATSGGNQQYVASQASQVGTPFVFVPGQYKLFAKCTKTGQTDSEVVSFDLAPLYGWERYFGF